MKPVRILLLFVTAFVFSVANAQQDNGKPAANEAMVKLTAELMEEYYKYIREQTKNGDKPIDKDDSKKLIEYFNSNGELRNKKEKLYGTGYSKPIVFQMLAGESDRIAMLKGIPVPKEPAQALQADPRENEKYADKVKARLEQYKTEAQALANTTQLAKAHQQGGDEAVKKMYEKQANQNEMIAQMGGVEKLQKMSEQERKEAAAKMVAAQTGGLTPEQIQRMTPEQKQALARQMAASKAPQRAGGEAGAAFTQEMMANESYRKRFEAMSTEEKQAEFKKFEERYYGPNGKPANVATGKPGKDANEGQAEAREIEMLNKFQEQFYKELKDAAAPVGELMKRYEQKWMDDMEAIGKWASAATQALPVVRDSEYGPVRPGIELVYYTQQCMLFAAGKDKIAKQREVWEKMVQLHVPAFKKLDDFLATYINKPGLSDRMKLTLAGLMAAGYESIIDLNKQAAFITNQAAGIQLSYNCEVLKSCHDPR